VQFGLAMPDVKYTGHNDNEFKTTEQFLLDLQIVTEMMPANRALRCTCCTASSFFAGKPRSHRHIRNNCSPTLFPQRSSLN
jgi:hypothetical protein